jgi:hypothetical protein
MGHGFPRADAAGLVSVAATRLVSIIETLTTLITSIDLPRKT